jgi:hypothetical protein
MRRTWLPSIVELLRCQYVYFCTSKASKLSGKLSTWLPSIVPSRSVATSTLWHCRQKDSSAVSICSFVLALPQSQPARSGIAGKDSSAVSICSFVLVKQVHRGPGCAAGHRCALAASLAPPRRPPPPSRMRTREERSMRRRSVEDTYLVLCYTCVPMQLYVCPHTTICVSSYYYMCPHTDIYEDLAAARDDVAVLELARRQLHAPSPCCGRVRDQIQLDCTVASSDAIRR